MKKIILVGIILVFGLASSGFGEEVSNRQILEKLDKIETKINSTDVRIARLEEGQKSLQKQIDGLREEMRTGQQSLQSQINGLQNMILGVLAGIFALIAFVLWDRRTALAPAVRKAKELEEEEEKIKKALKEYSRSQPKMEASLKQAGLL